MSESAPHEMSPGRADEPAASTAPELPVVSPAVRATRALEALKAQADVALMLLEHTRDDAQIQNAINAAVEQVNAASWACWHLAQLRSTKGQG